MLPRTLLLAATLLLSAAFPRSAPAAALHFERNVGQAGESIDFLARGAGRGVTLDSSGYRLSLGGINASVRLVGASAAEGEALEPLPSRSHYFLGQTPDEWISNVPHYGRVRYRGVWPGIDVVYYGAAGGMEFDFIVAPGADPSQIRMSYDGAENIVISAGGDLELNAAGGVVRHRRPQLYQQGPRGREEIAGAFRINSEKQVSFEIDAYDPTRALVIDPVVEWGTFFGGAGDENIVAVAASPDGDVIVAGITGSSNTPTANPIQSSLSGMFDGFVAKISSDGQTLRWSTYLGGNMRDQATGVAVDEQGVVVVGGYTESANFPTSTGAYQRQFGGQFDAFVTKISADGSRLLASTYFGSRGFEDAGRLRLDAAGNVYFVGKTNFVELPVSPNAAQPQLGGGIDAYVAKLDADLRNRLYASYLGAAGDEQPADIEVSETGELYLAAIASAGGLTPTADAFQPGFGGGVLDALLAKLSADGSKIEYLSYIGGSGSDNARTIARDPIGNIWIGGGTASTDFPVTPDAPQSTFGGGPADGWYARIPMGDSAVSASLLGPGGAVTQADFSRPFATYVGDERMQNILDLLPVDEARFLTLPPGVGVAKDSLSMKGLFFPTSVDPSQEPVPIPYFIAYLFGKFSEVGPCRDGDDDIPGSARLSAPRDDPSQEFAFHEKTFVIDPKTGRIVESICRVNVDSLDQALLRDGSAVAGGVASGPGSQTPNALQGTFGGGQDGWISKMMRGGPELAIEKEIVDHPAGQVDPDNGIPIIRGDQAQMFRVKVTNTAPAGSGSDRVARGVQLIDRGFNLKAEVDGQGNSGYFQNPSGNSSFCEVRVNASGIQEQFCDLGDLAPGQMVEVFMPLRGDSAGPASNLAVAAALNARAVLDGISLIVTDRATLVVEKEFVKFIPRADGLFTAEFVIRVRNPSISPQGPIATGVRVNEDAAGIDWAGGAFGPDLRERGANCVINPNKTSQSRCTVPFLLPGETWTISSFGKVVAARVSNLAVARADNADTVQDFVAAMDAPPVVSAPRFESHTVPVEGWGINGRYDLPGRGRPGTRYLGGTSTDADGTSRFRFQDLSPNPSPPVNEPLPPGFTPRAFNSTRDSDARRTDVWILGNDRLLRYQKFPEGMIQGPQSSQVCPPLVEEDDFQGFSAPPRPADGDEETAAPRPRLLLPLFGADGSVWFMLACNDLGDPEDVIDVYLVNPDGSLGDRINRIRPQGNTPPLPAQPAAGEEQQKDKATIVLPEGPQIEVGGVTVTLQFAKPPAPGMFIEIRPAIPKDLPPPGKEATAPQPAISFSRSLLEGASAVTGDLDNDGDDDYVIAYKRYHAAFSYLVTDNGLVTVEATAALPPASDAVLMDFDQDQTLDLVVLHGPSAVDHLPARSRSAAGFRRPGDTALENSVSFLRGRGDGTFEDPVFYPVEEDPAGLSIGDFDQDDRVDLAVVGRRTGMITMLMNRNPAAGE